MKRVFGFLSLYFSFLYLSFCQNTIGLISYEPEQSQPGYNLVYPHNQSTVFLIDNCGQVVHKWEDDDDLRPGNSAYLLPNGNLIKTARPFSFMGDAIWAGGGGATVEGRNWDNILQWSFTQNDATRRLHHDIAPMANGNVLMISWEKISMVEAVDNGRDPDSMTQNELWPDYILEYNPATGNVVWQWHAWDHLIQDFDPAKMNFGTVSDHPELINLNWDNHNGHPDWMHVNAIDYNEYLDQIVISVPYFDEIWVIDHSTTTQEAKGHTGGDYGKGGDLLYRWGNPVTYKQDVTVERQLFFPHDIHWIDPQATPTDINFGKMAVFNNRVTSSTSSANIILTPFDTESNQYIFNQQEMYGPENFERTITHPEAPVQASSNSVSGVQILPNGNALVCSGRWGFNFEITPEDEVVWEYVLPLRAGNPAPQGEELSINDNFLFRMKRYSENYGAFNNRSLDAQGYLELNPNLDFCDQLLSISSEGEKREYSVSPTLVSEYLKISTNENFVDVSIFNVSGELVKNIQNVPNDQNIDCSGLNSGMYFLSILPGNFTCKIIKL